MEIVKSLDYLSTEAKLTFNSKGDTRNKTIVGGFLSIFGVLSSFILSIFFFVDFIQRNEKSLITNVGTSYNVNITNSNNIPFLFRLTDPHNRPYANSDNLYRVAMKFWHGADEDSSEDIEQNYIDIQVERCNISHFGQYKYLFEHYNDLDTFYCALPRYSNQTIYGMYGDIHPFGYYHFYIYLCINESDDDTCIEQKESEALLSNTYLEIRTVDYSIENEHLNHVSKPLVRTDRHMLSMTVYKRIWLFINEINYISDNGILFESKETEHFHQVDSYRYDVDLRNITKGTIPGTFATLSILSTGNIIYYTRRYSKIQDYLATVGGIVHIISTFTYVVNFYISKNYYYLRLIDEFIIDHGINVHRRTVQMKLLKQTRNEDLNIKSLNSLKKREPIRINASLHKNNKKALKRNLNIKWYKMLFPLGLALHNDHFILSKIKFINDSLSLIELMKCIEDHRILLSRALKSQKIEEPIFINNYKAAKRDYGIIENIPKENYAHEPSDETNSAIL